MDKNAPSTLNDISDLVDFSQKEIDILNAIKESGAKPVAASLQQSLYNLFLEGYSCSEISKQGKGLSEGDILYLRWKHKWDQTRRDYMSDLQNQIQGKLIKSKMEAVEFLTNQMSAIHKSNRDQTLKYIMTGNPDDMPKELGKLGGYRQIVELLQTVTGEDKVQKVKIDQKTESTIKISSNEEKDIMIVNEILKPSNAAKMIKMHLKDKK